MQCMPIQEEFETTLFNRKYKLLRLCFCNFVAGKCLCCIGVLGLVGVVLVRWVALLALGLIVLIKAHGR